MKAIRIKLAGCLGVALLTAGFWVQGQPAAAPAGKDAMEPVLLTVEGSVEVSRAGIPGWESGRPNENLHLGDRVRTGLRSRAVVRFSSLSVMRINELTTFVVQPPSAAGKPPRLEVRAGSTYFFSRERPADVEFSTPLSSGAIRGTEFLLRVDPTSGRDEVALLDGALSLSNAFGTAELTSGQQAVIEPGGAPEKSALLNAVNIIQWCLYYPGVLNVDELGLAAGGQTGLADSVAAYRQGDLLKALAAWPAGYQPQSAAETTYFAALLLAAGQVEQARAQLATLPAADPLAQSLREVVAAVTFETWQGPLPSQSATGWLADSYYRQSRSDLVAALAAARRAVALAPNFGFGWERVAELEFSFGRVPAARKALEQAIKLSPRNAEAAALEGFLLAAENHYADARRQFDAAIALDGGLGNAWFGRGLVRIHGGEDEAGRADLQVAATLEPLRAVFRSYLGKAFSNAGDDHHAEKELARAKILDPNDPTVWLYEALLNGQESRINDAISNLEKSQQLNDNRSVYRSKMLLDQDRAVRGANLAVLYQDDGMTDTSLQEAVKAVNADYADFSSHLFLANSYYNLLDPNEINLRYETPYVSEYLMANLLSPVGAGTLSQPVSQQEYGTLFEQNGVGLSSDTTYTSHGDWRQDASEYGTYGNTSFSLEQYYLSDNLYRPNSDGENTEYDFKLKQQLTPRDGVFVQVVLANSEGGNQSQFFDQTQATNFPYRVTEKQEPILIAGYHHEWSPGVDTLVLFSRLNDTYSVTNPVQLADFVYRDMPGGTVLPALPQIQAGQNYRSTLNIYSLEAQQLWQADQWTTVAGGRVQEGDFNTRNLEDSYDLNAQQYFPSSTIADQTIDSHFERENVYLYEQWQPVDALRLIGGVAYDRLIIPEDFRSAPLVAGTETLDHVLPKAGVIWTPFKDTTLRAAYAESVSGASIDQDFQLEPTSVAGFDQAFRSLIPESVAGANAGATFTVYGVSLEQKLPTRTYLSVEGDLLKSRVLRQDGTFELDFSTFGSPPIISSLNEELRFTEEDLTFSAHQLLGRDWALGASYKVSRARLDDRYPGVDDATAAAYGWPDGSVSATLQTAGVQAIYQNPSGCFAQASATWTRQDNDDPSAPTGDDFWQCNLLAGQRFFHRHAEISLGILNLTGSDYHLNPLNLYQETPRERTFFTEFKFYF
jgi:tetratricopeptide (TPR) repeat protein